MADEFQQTPPHKNGNGKKTGFLDSWLADAVGVGITSVAGVIASIVSINDKYFSNAEKYDIKFLNAINARDAALVKLHENPANTGHVLVEEIEKVREAYNTTTKARLKDLRVKLPWEKWHTLHDHQKWEVRLAVAAAAAITLGAVVSLASSWRVSQKQDELEKRLDEMNGNGHRHGH